MPSSGPLPERSLFNYSLRRGRNLGSAERKEQTARHCGRWRIGRWNKSVHNDAIDNSDSNAPPSATHCIRQRVIGTDTERSSSRRRTLTCLGDYRPQRSHPPALAQPSGNSIKQPSNSSRLAPVRPLFSRSCLISVVITKGSKAVESEVREEESRRKGEDGITSRVERCAMK